MDLLTYVAAKPAGYLHSIHPTFLDHIALTTTYTDVVHCYSLSSIMVCWSVCQSVTPLSLAKIAEPIEMPFGSRTRVGTGNHVLYWGPHPLWEWAIFRGKGRHIVKYGDTLHTHIPSSIRRKFATQKHTHDVFIPAKLHLDHYISC